MLLGLEAWKLEALGAIRRVSYTVAPVGPGGIAEVDAGRAAAIAGTTEETFALGRAARRRKPWPRG